MNKENWIPTSAGLFPDEKEIVQVTYIGRVIGTNGINYCDAFAYRENGKWFWNDDDGVPNVNIIAWRFNCEPYVEK